MSQLTQTAQRVATPAPNRQQQRSIVNRDELSNLPTRKGREGALEFFREMGITGITPTRLRYAQERGELRRFTLAGHSWYADVDLWDWLQTLASGGQEAQQ
ncbi:hypothetical protein [Tsukamurella pseudospumae]|uniref:AlpA family phage regulatory protein n=1 Tax=Tsukamurella pseudospumae TaxID=239498 RepID=A0A137YZD0_9ACTN|nr:hypothetical protein [Tsukamurella pseudospumae]KXO91299.1 hypothetical protein AXK61_07025 [Tsukamurella pseudospumae]